MATVASSPVARRWQLAAQLRKLREDSGKTIEDTAAELMCSVAKVSRMETADRGIQPRDVRDLCRFYRVPKAIQDELLQFAVEAQRPGWWHDFRTMDEQVATYIGLESAAQTLRGSDALRLPGLLQTPEFTAALLAGIRFPPEKTNTWAEETLESRSKRQERVKSGELEVHVIIDEAALRRPIGDRNVMIGQLERLLADAELPNVTIQIIPFEVGAHPGIEGAFAHLRFPEGQLGDIVFIEGTLGNYILDKSAVVDQYLGIFEHLSSKCALPPAGTLDWLESLLQEISHTGPKGRRSKASPI
jgi:transcriptional regulator with XRE-family HTH domain